MNVLDTTIFSIFGRQVETIKEIAEEAFALDNQMFIGVADRIYKVRPDVTPSEVPIFNVTIDVRIDGEMVYLIDTRSFENVNRVTQPVEYNQTVLRAKAYKSWMETPSKYEGILAPLTAVYTEWCTGLIRSTTGLSPIQLVMYEVMLGLYMYTAIKVQADAHIPSDEIITGYRRFSESKLRTSRQVLDAVFEGDNGLIAIDAMKTAFENGVNGGSLNMLLAGANRIVASPSASFDGPAMVKLAERSWMGNGATMLSSAAIQHPAILATLISIAATNPIYRRSKIGESVHNLKRRGIDASGVLKALV